MSGVRATNPTRALGSAWLMALSVGWVGSACSTKSSDGLARGGDAGGPLAAGGSSADPGGGGGVSSGRSGAAAAGSPVGGTDGTGGNIGSGARPSSGGTPGSAAGSMSAVAAGDGGGSVDGGAGGESGDDDYDEVVLSDQPVGYWAINRAPEGEPDLSGHGHEGQYRGQGATARATLPNGASVVKFDGATQYLSIPSSPAFSIPTTGSLTWEAWLRPEVLQFPNDDGSSGYVDWLGKCEDYAPTCEWEARMYNTTTSESPNRPNRFSAYVFNPSAGLGSGADWQPSAGVITAGSWYHVVGEYTTLHQPADCKNTNDAPGSIEIWVNGVKWDHDSHGQTGCMSQYGVVPKANDSAVNVATMAKESFFQGAIGKVALYDHLLSAERIELHYTIMTGKPPKGSCGDTCSFE